MTITIDINPELEAQLAAQARAEGVDLETVVERLLRRSVAQETQPPRLTIEDVRTMFKALAAGAESLPKLATESFTRASFYEDRI